MKKLLASAIRITEALLPAHCIHCDQPCGGPTWLCPACRGAIKASNLTQTVTNTKWWPDVAQPPPRHTGGRNTLAALSYEGVTRELIQRWKFGGQMELTELLVNLAVEVRPLAGAIPDVIAPIPMHWLRRLKRGFNQSSLLANAYRRHLHRQVSQTVPIRQLLGARHRNTSQHSLGRRARLAPKHSQFFARVSLRGEHVLLIDDVITTGATVSAATQTLLGAGAGRVTVWCLAQTPLQRPQIEQQHPITHW